MKTVLLSITELFVKHREVVRFEKEISEIPGLIDPKIAVDVRMGRDNDVPGLRRFLPRFPARVFCSRLSRGDIVFIAKINDKIVHQMWISFKDSYAALLDKEIVLKEGEVYAYHAYTAPEFRGNNIHAAVIRKALRYLKAQGYKRFLFLVNRNYRHKPYRGAK